MVTMASPYLEQHEVVSVVFGVVTRMRNSLLDASDLPGVIFISFDGVNTQQNLLHAAGADQSSHVGDDEMMTMFL